MGLHALPQIYLLDKKPCQQQLTNQFVKINGQNINILFRSGSYGGQNGNGYHTSYHYQRGETQKRSLPTSKSSFTPSILTIFIKKSVKPVFQIFWASWIRIRNYFVQIQILHSRSKKINKNLFFCRLVTSLLLLSLKTDLKYLQNEISKTN